jgi:hypothetical protein
MNAYERSVHASQVQPARLHEAGDLQRRHGDRGHAIGSASDADLAVAVKGDRIRVVKDRYGAPADISKPQLDDIRTLDPEVIQC